MEFYLACLKTAFSPVVLLYAIGGVALGVTVGAIPGIGGTSTIALCLPMIPKMHPLGALGFLIGIYKGSTFGGAISAITFGIPGTPAAVATVFDGVPLRKKGHPKQAMMTALFSSVTGDIFSDLILVFLAVPMAMISLKFGPTEFFSLYLFALMLIGLLIEGNVAKGLAMTALGLIIGCIGSDPVSGAARFTFGIDALRGGIGMTPFMVGVFALGEIFTQFYTEWHKVRDRKMQEIMQKAEELTGYDPKKDKFTWKHYRDTFKATMIGACFGTVAGALPGAGSSMAAMASYSLARRFSKHPEEFGKGSMEGIAAPEAGNSATCGACFIPMFAFGIPGTATAALFMVALMMQGITCGPLMLEDNASTMTSFFIIMIMANVFNLFLSWGLLPIYAKISQIKPRFMVPVVLAIALLGGYAAQNSTFDVLMLLIFGFLGVYLKKHNYPTGPLVLAYILGPGMERSLSQALAINRGSWMGLLKSPIALGFYAAAVVLFFLINRSYKANRELARQMAQIAEEES